MTATATPLLSHPTERAAGRHRVGRHRSASRRSVSPPASGFRPDIEGLRALAVGLVILDHLFHWPVGGFVGVDVFFVLSGYLITGLLIQDTRRRGRLSFRHFYKRRARRILPASLAVLVVTAIAAHLLFAGVRVRQTVDDIWWALGFSANIHFARIGTDYFQLNRPPSPVQHFWSLAVEEQFYVLWPVAVLVVLSVCGRRLTERRALGLLVAVCSAACVASFAWAIHATDTNPSAAYFSTAARAWELGLGALTAIVVALVPDLGRRLRGVAGPLTLVGLAGVALSAFTVAPSPGFPAPRGALPVLSTVVLVVAGLGRPARGWTFLLTNRASRYVGRISYSLYLWHWPVIVLTPELVDPASRTRYVAALAGMFGLSMLSYHLIEAPLRGVTRAKIRHASRPGTWRPAAARNAAVLIAASALLALPVLTVAVRPAAAMNQRPPAAALAPDPAAVAQLPSYVARPSDGLRQAISDSLAATTFPAKLDPSLDVLSYANAQSSWNGCRGTACTVGDPRSPKRAVVLGDSYAMAWMPAIRDVLLPKGYSITGLMNEACQAAKIDVDVPTSTGPVLNQGCPVKREQEISQALAIDPQLVILASADNVLDRLHDHATGGAARAEYQAGTVTTIQRLQPGPNRRILTLGPPPSGQAMASCDTPRTAPPACIAEITDRWRIATDAEAAAAQQTRTDYLDTHLWFCSASGYCPAFVGSTAVKWDGLHMTGAYADRIAPELDTAMTQLRLV